MDESFFIYSKFNVPNMKNQIVQVNNSKLITAFKRFDISHSETVNTKLSDSSSQTEIIRALVNVGNGYSLSVILIKRPYEGHQGLYEVAVKKDGDLDYSTPITNDVIPNCTEEDVIKHLIDLSVFANGLPSKNKEINLN